MTTPSRSNIASTPRINPDNTPTRMHNSPRTGISVPSRPFAGKSPAGKTPAGKTPAAKTPASLQSHSHDVSTSSHPASTPRPATSGVDDMMGFSSPAAALMASLGGQGLTPIPRSQNGLGISTLVHPAQAPQVPAVRNPGAEKRQRLQEAVDILRPRLAGRGITREGIERLAKSNSFELLPDEHNITVAGHNCVDLEVNFDPVVHDRVKDVSLKLNMSAPGEDTELQKDASAVLRSQLEQVDASHNSPWNSLVPFAANLEYLGRLDQSSSNLNCFAAVRELHKTFRSIWDEEKKRLSWRNELQHICKSVVGVPRMDSGERVGLTVDYWVNNPDVEFDQSANNERPKGAAASDGRRSSICKALISCESGSPSISKSLDWLAAELVAQDDSESIQTEASAHRSKQPRPAWKLDVRHDPNSAEGLETLIESSNVRFACTLEPPILLPLNAILALNAAHQIVEVDQSKIITYQHELDALRKSADADVSFRSTRQLPVFDKTVQVRRCKHSCAAYFASPVWCYWVSKLSFAHPQHFAEAVPTLRLYTVLWTLLQKAMSGEPPPSVGDALPQPSSNGTKRTPRINRPLKRSNRSSYKAKLDDILANAGAPDDTLNIDISVASLTDPTKVQLHLIVPLPRPPHFLSLTIDISPDAEFWVESKTGNLADENIHRRMSRVLEISEDLGVLVEWALEKLEE